MKLHLIPQTIPSVGLSFSLRYNDLASRLFVVAEHPCKRVWLPRLSRLQGYPSFTRATTVRNDVMNW